MAHEIVERNHELAEGLARSVFRPGASLSRGDWRRSLVRSPASSPPVGLLDVSFYRDDLSLLPGAALVAHDYRPRPDGPFGRPRRRRALHRSHDTAALNALTDWGVPRSVQLAVMVDRGHRELPIRPDFVGKNLPNVARRSHRGHARWGLDRHEEAVIETLRGQSLLSLEDLTREAIVEILDTAETFVEVNRRTIKKVPALKGESSRRSSSRSPPARVSASRRPRSD